ncbi:LuxR family transcriptional regulator [Nocardioides immobilis]|uniref:LuxR family transcriptional regulator n=2 Tax=Nocardioides immobilis TaxID=2049295 RepID=A0A417Y0U3_9ACTN|nr:LuxR family transcriptional regulator [Nocardioides immobilis]
MNRLIARRHELAEAVASLAGSRLLTFTGPGGVGKTRLALEVGYRARSGYCDGVWLAELSDLRIDAGVAEVEAALISALGVVEQSAREPRDKLFSFLRKRRVLLILDNCEHVLASVRAVLPLLLREVPQLRVVATSREPLAVEGEVLRPVRPLTAPEPGTPVAQLVIDGSVSLLIDRARAVDPAFDVTEENAEAVIALCRLLEGVPLAIELAAAKFRALTVEQVVDRFASRLTSLSAPGALASSRHRSLGAMVEWSYELCSAEAQVLWRRLSVFPAGFDLDLAEAVCCFGELAPVDVVDTIERLVGQSILLADRNAGVMRYRLLVPLREVAAELADNAGETTQLERRHRDVMVRRSEEMLDRWSGPRQDALISRMRQDHASYVAAIQWSEATSGEQETGLRLLGRLRYYWLGRGALAEGRTRLESMLVAAPEPSRARAECVWVVTWIALLQGDHDAAAARLTDLRSLAAELNDRSLDVHVRHWSGLLAMFTGDPANAVSGLQAAVEGHRAFADSFLELTARYMLATALVCADRPGDALAMSRETIELCEQCGDQTARAYAVWAAAVAEWRLGRLDEAEQRACEALQLQRALSDGICVALSTNLLGCIAHDRRQRRRALSLALAAGRIWRSLGTSLEAFGPQLAELGQLHTPSLPSTAELEGLPAFGKLPDLEDVIDLGLGIAPGSTKGQRAYAEVLTKREIEVAAMIERGLSNREIAERLVIAKRTVDGHVERILAKLGFTSRAQVAAWMSRRGLGTRDSGASDGGLRR